MDYATVEELRAEGVTAEQASDAALLRRIRKASALIERWCGWWFYPRAQTLLLDGEGGRMLLFGAPIISIAEVSVNNSVIELEQLRIYNRHITQALTNPDDRNNPKLEWPIGANEMSAGFFPAGTQNIRVVGHFGYTDFDESDPLGITPILIRTACMLLVVRDLAGLGDTDSRDEARNRGRLVALRTRDQEISWASPGAGSGVGTRGTGAWSGDPEIDNLIASFRRPPVFGAT